jgi:hypothetical protein
LLGARLLGARLLDARLLGAHLLGARCVCAQPHRPGQIQSRECHARWEVQAVRGGLPRGGGGGGGPAAGVLCAL